MRAPVEFTRASGTAAHSRLACAAIAARADQRLRRQRILVVDAAAHTDSNPAGSRPDHARSHASKSSSTSIGPP